jgi:hypothetical protein
MCPVILCRNLTTRVVDDDRDCVASILGLSTDRLVQEKSKWPSAVRVLEAARILRDGRNIDWDFSEFDGPAFFFGQRRHDVLPSPRASSMIAKISTP